MKVLVIASMSENLRFATLFYLNTIRQWTSTCIQSFCRSTIDVADDAYHKNNRIVQ